MPLLKGHFSESDCEKFINSKEKLWADNGYGPWAFFIDDQFAGWGGLQPEEGEVDLAMVLHPDHWGIGKILYKMIIDQAFNEMDVQSVVVLFPPSRTRVSGLLQLGFERDREIMVGDETFIRYRLENPNK